MQTASYRCDMCSKLMDRNTLFCADCAAKLAERAKPFTCPDWGGTVRATSHGAGGYTRPYMCYCCMKDTVGRTWGTFRRTQKTCFVKAVH